MSLTHDGAEHRLLVGLALTKLGRASMRIVTEALSQTGVKPRHLGILSALKTGGITQQTLGDAVHTDATQLVVFLNELESAGLVTRRRDPNDRRRHIVEVSAVGAVRLAEAELQVARTEERLLAGLTDSERTELHRLLSHVAVNAGLSSSWEGAPEASSCESDGSAVDPYGCEA